MKKSISDEVKAIYRYGYERGKKGLTLDDGYLADHEQAILKLIKDTLHECLGEEEELLLFKGKTNMAVMHRNQLRKQAYKKLNKLKKEPQE